MKRKIVKIDKEKCNGCGLCVQACHEGAIQMRNGKAELVNEDYCDGLGDCLPVCPTGAIEIVETEFTKQENQTHDEGLSSSLESDVSINQKFLQCGCPGSATQTISRPTVKQHHEAVVQESSHIDSQLTNWPVQFKLINPYSKFFQDSHLLVAADCVAYAFGDFHQQFIKNRKVIIGCPKLDEIDLYYEKFLTILKNNSLKSITVVKMEVPCCNALAMMVKQAMLEARMIIPYSEITITVDGRIVEN